MTTQVTDKTPIPPLSNPITDRMVSLTWSAYFTNLKGFIDKLAAATLSPPKHNDLTDIQGGITTERYHLTEQQANIAMQLPAFDSDDLHFLNGNATFSTPNHENIDGLQGGITGQHYHLNALQFSQMQNLTGDGVATHFYNGLGSYSTPNHNDLDGLQGGIDGDRQHITSAQLASIASFQSTIFGYLTLGL